MAVLVVSRGGGGAGAAGWAARLRAAAPGVEVRAWGGAPGEARPPLEDVVHAVVWRPPPGLLARESLPALRGVQSFGAGVDHVVALPAGVPLARIVDPAMSQRMASFVVCNALNHIRCTEDYRSAQREGRWAGHLAAERERDVGDVSAGVMGTGEMGGAAAEMLRAVGFRVRTWSRTRRRGPPAGCEAFVGREELHEFLGGSDILVNLLPLTPETSGLVNADFLAHLPPGAFFINVARGGHVVDEDLLGALDSGRLGGALLDVFHEEPLPEVHPFWGHERVLMAPHVAAVTSTETALAQIVDNMRRTLEGRPMLNLVDVAAGY